MAPGHRRPRPRDVFRCGPGVAFRSFLTSAVTENERARCLLRHDGAVIEPSRPLFRILGPLEVWNGREWSQISAPKWRSLLAALLLRPGQPVSTGHLVEEIWGGAPPARAANLVSGYVLRLRRLLGVNGSRLVTRAPGYQIVLHRDDLDAERFARLMADGRRALAEGEAERAATLLTEALGLWRGAALTDVPPSPMVTAETDRLEESRLAAVVVRAEAELACGRHGPLVPELRRLLADHPLREELWALLVRALSGASRQASPSGTPSGATARRHPRLHRPCGPGRSTVPAPVRG